jgi:hypothetical protein
MALIMVCGCLQVAHLFEALVMQLLSLTLDTIAWRV